MEDHLGLVLMPLHAAATLLGAFGALALGLAVVGIYSVMACTVSQHTREIGIRMALGARLGDVLALVLREGLVVVGVGLLAGGAAAAGVTRFAASLFYGVSPTDPMTFAGALGLLGVAGLLAALVPALASGPHPSVRRIATGIDDGRGRALGYDSMRISSTSNTSMPAGAPGRPP